MLIKTNPFVFGKVVKGKQFFNRKQEINELMVNIKNHQNVILYAPRRYGKTSLVLKTFDEIKKSHKNFTGLYVDFFQVNSIDKFITILSNEYASNVKITFDKLLSTLKDIFTGITPSIALDREGNPKIDITITASNRTRLFEDVMKLPQKLVDSKKLVAVFFDEFQEVSNLNGFDFQKRLRAIIQHQSKVSYIFCGSKYHLFQNIFNNPNNPLFKIGITKYLNVIPEQQYSKFIYKNFIKIKNDFTIEHAKIIYHLADAIPYNVQLLCSEIYNLMLINKDVPSEKVIYRSYEKVIESKNEEYIILYENLNRSTRLALELLIKSNGENLFSKELLSDFRIAPSTLKKSLDKLIREGIIFLEGKRYLFQDVFFKKWLEKRL